MGRKTNIVNKNLVSFHLYFELETELETKIQTNHFEITSQLCCVVLVYNF